jgi:hypothetical protein
MPDLVTCVRCGHWAEWEVTGDGNNVICPNCPARPELVGIEEEERQEES